MWRRVPFLGFVLCGTLVFGECPKPLRSPNVNWPRGVRPETVVARFVVDPKGAPSQVRFETLVPAPVETAIRKAVAQWTYPAGAKPFEVRLAAGAAAAGPTDPKALYEAARAAQSGKDHRAAAALYRRAADQGLAEAQLQYGLLLKSGYGEGVDLVRAVGYLLLAERAGLDAALVPARAIRPAVHEDVLQLGEEFADNHVPVCEVRLTVTPAER